MKHGQILNRIKRTMPSFSTFVDANTTNDGDVTETQHATCKITTEELVASARATVTRVLTGACSASEKLFFANLWSINDK